MEKINLSPIVLCLVFKIKEFYRIYISGLDDALNILKSHADDGYLPTSSTTPNTTLPPPPLSSSSDPLSPVSTPTSLYSSGGGGGLAGAPPPLIPPDFLKRPDLSSPSPVGPLGASSAPSLSGQTHLHNNSIHNSFNNRKRFLWRMFTLNYYSIDNFE